MNTSNIKTSTKERLAVAYQILGGIPDEAIQLHRYLVTQGKTLDCGTICCGAGWLALHPTFNELGLYMNERTGMPYRKLAGNQPTTSPTAALDKVFGPGAFDKYFSAYGDGCWDIGLLKDTPGMSDKELILARLKKGYYEYAQHQKQH